MMIEVMSVLKSLVTLLLIAGISVVVTVLLLQWHRIRQPPTGVSWVGLERHRRFAKLRAAIGVFFKEKELLAEGWEKYSRHAEPFILPGLHWNEVVLPPDDIKWLASLPEDICDAAGVQNDLLGFQWLSHGPDLDWVRDFGVIKRDLKENMSSILSEIQDEVEIAVAELFGETEDWVPINSLKALRNVSFRAANRIIVGPKLCRDPLYLAACQRWMMAMGLTGMIARFFVLPFLKSQLMPIIAMPYKLAFRKASNMYLPYVYERLRTNRDVSPMGPQNDLLQWTIKKAMLRKQRPAISARDVSDKLVFLNIFAAHTINVSLGTIFIDILCQPADTDLSTQLRAEAEQVLASLRKDPHGLSKMHRMDSVIRESLRFNPPSDHGMMRKIVKEGGVTTPRGSHLPQGTHVGAHVSLAQRNATNGSDWDQYQPLRYLNSSEHTPDKSATAAHISDNFLPFSLGRHSCPGRFFAVNVLKLILGHLIAKYDIQLLQERPNFLSIGGVNLPPENLNVCVRQRGRQSSHDP